MLQIIRESLQNPYMFALATAVLARLTQWVSALGLLKSTDWQYHDDLFFINLADAGLRTTFIGINVLVFAVIALLGFIYCAYIKQPGSPSRVGLVALSASIFLVILHIIASLLLSNTAISSFNAAELGASMMRNFVVVAAGLFVGDWLHSVYE